MAFPRCCAGHVSATSTDPAAHSPPSPIPTTARQNTSSPTVREVAVNAVNAENARIDHISERARPYRSESQPNSMPPSAEVTSGAAPSAPAAAELKWNSSRIVVSAKEYSITSIASSIQPSCAAISVRHCKRVISRCHCIGLSKVTDNPQPVQIPGFRALPVACPANLPFIIKKFQYICVRNGAPPG